jgi:hypothetical protein
VLHLECTVNDVTFFSRHRKVEHRDGPPAYEVAPFKQSIFSLRGLRALPGVVEPGWKTARQEK